MNRSGQLNHVLTDYTLMTGNGFATAIATYCSVNRLPIKWLVHRCAAMACAINSIAIIGM